MRCQFPLFTTIVAMIQSKENWKPRAIAVDLDGTLLNHEGKITPKTAEALAVAYQSGVMIILASGRMSARVKPFADQLKIPTSIVAYNGAQILEKDGELWKNSYTREISEAAREKIWEMARERSLFLNVYADQKLYGYQKNGEYAWSDFYAKQTKSVYEIKTDDLSKLPKESIEKMLTIQTPEARDQLYTEMKPEFEPYCDVIKSNPEYLEFLESGTSKIEALKHLLQSKGLTSDDLLAFGDAENDLPMLQEAKLGIAMSNATPGVKKVFSNISKWSCDEDGIAEELKTWFKNIP